MLIARAVGRNLLHATRDQISLRVEFLFASGLIRKSLQSFSLTPRFSELSTAEALVPQPFQRFFAKPLNG